MNKTFRIASIALAASLCAALPALGQIAGGTTSTGVAVIETTQLATGWSVKKTLMGKTIYNEAGAKVGQIQDLIISTDKSVSYVIVGAGGFVGIGRHDVAIPVSQIDDSAGRLVMAGATKDMIKSMPRFEYANDSAKRDQFISAADREIAKGKASLAELEKKAGSSATDVRARLDMQISSMKLDVRAAEAKLGEMKEASAKRWKEFEAGVNAATARLRKSIDTAAA